MCWRGRLGLGVALCLCCTAQGAADLPERTVGGATRQPEDSSGPLAPGSSPGSGSFTEEGVTLCEASDGAGGMPVPGNCGDGVLTPDEACSVLRGGSGAVCLAAE